MKKKIGFISLGCAKNLTDTETMLALLKNENYIITPNADEAEIIVVNTCAFIDSAKEESINAIIEMAQKKEEKLELLIVTGCLAQRYKDEIQKELGEVDIILGTNDYPKIAMAIDDFYLNNKKVVCVSDANDHTDENLPREISTPSHFAYLKIADGCDNFCTYCIIPKLRGKYRSRSVESILNEAKELAKKGVKEVILVAQDTAYYGFSDMGGYKLSYLLKEISKIDGLEWIRLQYCYPENITDDLINEIATNKKIVKYIDMPLQHVSDNVLKRMGRKSSEAEINSLIDKLREKIPQIVIRTSLICGFPGESEDDFLKLYNFLKEKRLDKVGVFPYSKEEGTPAYKFENQIDEDIKQQRYQKLMEIQNDVSYLNNKDKIGKELDVIIDAYDEDEICYIARTYGDTPDVDEAAYVYSQYEHKLGDIVKIKVLDAHDYDITGEVIL
ncbi:MAG: 30S ribosomal protein S12 methylthiotransferase RimO [Ruminococcaceae bacterium]|nr:30S ribosomal protein S12 methylthiotransferase RimO [Oscillospiraceae bacterium]